MVSNKRYQIRYNERAIEISRANSSTLVYRVPYQNIKDKNEKFPFALKNTFIVYILFGKNNKGKDAVYVGKSKNGITDRPGSHDDKYDNWTYCYILTHNNERTFFNDATIQYIEDKINNKFNTLGSFDNTTKTTTSGTANSNDESDCEEYLEDAYQMLDVLGLDLISPQNNGAPVNAPSNVNPVVNNKRIPNGIYTLSRQIKRAENQVFTAKLKVAKGSFMLQKGSEICPDECAGLPSSIIEKRKNARIVNNVLCEDIEFSTPSYAAAFVLGAVCNGWLYWTDDEGQLINKFKT